jgi:hypothetical protein
MSSKLMRKNGAPLSYHHPITPKLPDKQPTAINGQKVHEKHPKNKPTYSKTLNNYEAIRNLVTMSPSDNNSMLADVGKKKVSIQV